MSQTGEKYCTNCGEALSWCNREDECRGAPLVRSLEGFMPLCSSDCACDAHGPKKAEMEAPKEDVVYLTPPHDTEIKEAENGLVVTFSYELELDVEKMKGMIFVEGGSE